MMTSSTPPLAAAVRVAYLDELRHRRLRRGDAPQGEGGSTTPSTTHRPYRTSNIADMLNPVHGDGEPPPGGPVWHAIAQRVRELGLDAQGAMRAAFAVVGDAPRAPNPNEIQRLFRTPEFANASEHMIVQATASLNSQLRVAGIALAQVMALGDRTANQAWVEILDSGQWALTPLFRFMAAAHLQAVPGMQEIVARWHAAARLQFSSDAAIYDAAWAELEPRRMFHGNGPTPSPRPDTTTGLLSNSRTNVPSTSVSTNSRTPTGIPWLDALLEGGHAAGEVYGLLGPYGSCKSTVAMMITVEAARVMRLNERQAATGNPRVAAFFASYETGLPELWRRSMSYAAMVDRGHLEAGELDTQERRRVEQATHMLGDSLQLLHIPPNGPDDAPADGWGSLAQAIAERCDRTDQRCGVVVIDYLGLLVRFSAGRLDDAAHQRHAAEMLRHAAVRARTEIAERFGCPVWLVHQLSPEANCLQPWVRLDGRDAAGSKTLIDSLDASVILGRPASDRRLLVWARRNGSTPYASNGIVKIEGQFSRVVTPGVHNGRGNDASTAAHRTW